MHSARSKGDAFLKVAENYFDSASEQAEAGDLTAAATLILKALAQERKASVAGPQVLQLIKPST